MSIAHLTLKQTCILSLFVCAVLLSPTVSRDVELTLSCSPLGRPWGMAERHNKDRAAPGPTLLEPRATGHRPEPVRVPWSSPDIQPRAAVQNLRKPRTQTRRQGPGQRKEQRRPAAKDSHTTASSHSGPEGPGPHPKSSRPATLPARGRDQRWRCVRKLKDFKMP